MDPLSAAASVMAVIQISASVFDVCRTYYTAVKDARKDIMRLQNELRSLESVLTSVADIADADNAERLSTLQMLIKPEGPISQCREDLEGLMGKLQDRDGDDRMKQFGARALKWPFKSKDIDKFIAVIERHKSLFDLALTADQVTLNLTMTKTLDVLTQQVCTTQLDVYLTRVETSATRESVEAMQKDSAEKEKIETLKRVIEWLSVTDPSSNLQAASGKHEPGTGQWLLEGIRFREWKRTQRAFMWLYGIPSCGKTILCSTIINHLTEIYNDNPKSILGYFYFDFNDTNKQGVLNCLFSLLAQLCNQVKEIPEGLMMLYESCRKGYSAPRVNQLVSCLSLFTKMKMVDDIFLVLDALDECPKFGDNDERTELLKVLKTIHGFETSKFHLIVTSRQEPDIREALAPLLSVPALSIQGAATASDIQIYIRSQLSMEPKLKCWPGDVKLEIENALAAGADGMFRWVFCQLDALKKCKKRSSVMKALKELPKTLDDTYERILSAIDETYQSEARRALFWLAFSQRPLSINEVAEAACIDPDAEVPFDPEDRFHDPENDILEILGSLVTISTKNDDIALKGGDGIKLAHFSVREYLLSSRLHNSPSAAFSTSEVVIHRWCSRSCLAYFTNFSCIQRTSRDFSEAYFFEYACLYWPYHARHIPEDIEENDPLLETIYLSTSIFSLWQERLPSTYEFPGMSTLHVKKSSLTPLVHASAMGLPSIVKRLLLAENPDANTDLRGQYTALHLANVYGNTLTAKLLLQSKLCTLLLDALDPEMNTALHVASSHGDGEMVSLLLGHGAATKLKNAFGETALMLAARSGHINIVQWLMQYESKENMRESEKTEAVLLATRAGHFKVVKLLLDLGVHPGEDSLHQLARPESSDYMKLFLEHGADPNAKDDCHNTVLHRTTQKGRVKLVELLLSYGGNPELGDADGKTPFHYACARADVTVMRVFLKHGVSLSLADGPGRNGLHYASLSWNEEAVRLLLDHGADIEARSRRNETPLQLAAQRGGPGVVECLLTRGADISSQNVFGRTALHFAAVRGNREVLEVLLKYNADPRVRDFVGKTPREVLLDYENRESGIMGLKIRRVE